MERNRTGIEKPAYWLSFTDRFLIPIGSFILLYVAYIRPSWFVFENNGVEFCRSIIGGRNCMFLNGSWNVNECGPNFGMCQEELGMGKNVELAALPPSIETKFYGLAVMILAHFAISIVIKFVEKIIFGANISLFWHCVVFGVIDLIICMLQSFFATLAVHYFSDALFCSILIPLYRQNSFFSETFQNGRNFLAQSKSDYEFEFGFSFKLLCGTFIIYVGVPLLNVVVWIIRDESNSKDVTSENQDHLLTSI